MTAFPILESVAGVAAPPGITLDGRLTDPDSGCELEVQRASTPERVDIALAGAEELHRSGAWSDRTFAERRALLDSFTWELHARAEAIATADAVDSGVPLTVGRSLVEGACAVPGMLGQLAESLLVDRLAGPAGPVDQWWLPLGPAVVLAPWNAPAVVAISKVACALAAGAPVILKPSEWSPRSAAMIAEAAASAGLPAQALQVVHGGGAVGQHLVADRRVAAVSLTGGVATGRAVAAACADRFAAVDLELSGLNPAVVLDDADLQDAAAQLIGGMTLLNGQWCAAPRHALVPATLLDDLVDAMRQGLHRTRIGATDDSSTQLGPLAHPSRVEAFIADRDAAAAAGAKVYDEGTLPTLAGHFVRPALVVLPPGSRPAREVFGPLLYISSYDHVDDAVLAANDHPYGLSAYVLTADDEAGRTIGARLRAGVVRVGTVSPGLPAEAAVASMWGSSGQGITGLTSSVRFFTGARCVG